MGLPTLKWGVLGCGFISTQFVQDICEEKTSPKANHIIQAIGASSKAKGDKFASDFAINQKPTVASYDEVINDPEVEIVYIGLPHTTHYDYTIQALNAGKHVLCEKPIAVNGKQAKEMFDLAKEKNLFLMEAVWTRFFPIIKELKDHVHGKKTIGEVSRIVMDFSIDMNIDKLGPESRLKNPKFAGGALLDVGIYNLTYWRLFLDSELGQNAVQHEVLSSQIIKDGIDVQTDVVIKQKDNKLASLTNSFYNKSEFVFARIDGELGSIYIGGDFSSEPRYYKIVFKDENTPDIEKHVSKGAINGLIHESDAVAKDIAEGKIQNDLMPWDESLLVMKTMDDIRKANGLRFPVKYD